MTKAQGTAPPIEWPMVSADTHIIEPPDLWTTHTDKAFRDRAPSVRREHDGDWWYIEGERTLSFAGGAQSGDRFENPIELRSGAYFAEVRPGGYEPNAHLADNESDGVYASLLFPTEGLMLYRIADSALLSALARAYNDWLANFCAAAPQRLYGCAMVNIDDPADAIAEMTRNRKRGMTAALLPTQAPPGAPYTDPKYEPMWAASQDLDMPFCMHLGANRAPSSGHGEDIRAIRPSYFTVMDMPVRQSFADMIFAGVFDRYPNLKVGSVEHELGWLPFFLDRLDNTYTQRHGNKNYYRFKDGALPSDLFHRNGFASFQDDGLGIRERERIGIDGLMWGSDYPHTESTFPRSKQINGERLAGVPDGEQKKMLRDNARRILHIG
jgi:predicted TIM-barrel fold metal-dependent hydrolase